MGIEEHPDGENAATSTDDPERQGRLRWTQRTELISVLLLSIASLAAAWCGYQASEWSGKQSTYFSQASARRIDATHTLTSAYIYAVGDSGLFNGWAEAYVAGNEPLMQFYRNRFSDEMDVAMVAWLATDPLNNPDAPDSPISMPEYRLAELQQASELEAQANQLFIQGQDANKTSDAYVLDTVIFAAVLFFAGLATKVSWFPARSVTIGLSALMLIIGLVRLVTLEMG